MLSYFHSGMCHSAEYHFAQCVATLYIILQSIILVCIFFVKNHSAKCSSVEYNYTESCFTESHSAVLLNVAAPLLRP